MSQLRKLRRAHKQNTLPSKTLLAFSAMHEAAHAVTALAVGVQVERAYLTPKPQIVVLTEGADVYQLATQILAGPIADNFTGLIPDPGEADYHEWLATEPTKDVRMVIGLAHEALGIDLGPATGERDGFSLYGPMPQAERDRHGPALAAWFEALEQVSMKLVANNWEQIQKVARALLARPSGLTGAEMREVAGPLTVISVDRLHEVIDTLALNGIDGGSAAMLWGAAQKHAKQRLGAAVMVSP
ncbi:MAG: hypothetical protein ABUL60_29725 [Myxococcales bacterium]